MSQQAKILRAIEDSAIVPVRAPDAEQEEVVQTLLAQAPSPMVLTIDGAEDTMRAASLQSWESEVASQTLRDGAGRRCHAPK